MPTKSGVQLSAKLRRTLKQARERQELSAAALAEQVGISQQAIDRYEKGQRSPSDAVLRKWAKVLGYRVEIGETRLVAV